MQIYEMHPTMISSELFSEYHRKLVTLDLNLLNNGNMFYVNGIFVCQFLTDDDWRLILIKQKSVVGSVLEDHQIYKVNKIIVVPLSDADPQELDLDVSVYFFFKVHDSADLLL